MKLAEALITRKEMYRKLSQLAERIQKNSRGDRKSVV